MKESVYIEGQENDYESKVSTKKPIVLILIVSVVLILLLNFINTLVFY